MSYVDVETSAEGIQEDEELIEAVEKVAEAIYKDIRNDVSGFYLGTRLEIENMFPFVAYWREDRSFFWADMETLALSGVLFLIAFWILSPSSRWVKKSGLHSNKNKRGSMSAKRTNSLERINFTYFRTLSPFCRTSSKPPFERSRSTSSIDYPIYRAAEIEDEEEEESEEEKFVKRWPSILETGYCCLVLPPECKRMEKPRLRPKKEKKAKKEDKKKEDSDNVDDDHPANRLINYTRQFLHLIMSLLRVDYVGAGWTLIHWVESCLRSRKNRGKPAEYDDDDQSIRSSMSGQLSDTNSAAKLKPRPRMRSKRDSVMKIHKVTNAQKKDGDPGETNDSSDQVHLSLNIDPSKTDESEEKKESLLEHDETSSETPPQSPRASLSRTGSSSSIYETPNLDINDLRELDPGEVLATKLLNARMPFLGVPLLGAKTKDALEHYRTPSSRKGPPMIPASPQMRCQENKSAEPHFASMLPERRDSGSAYYFETVSTKESLRKMAVDVPYPDKNGYVLGDDFLPDNSWTPLLVFVNSRSGPQQGHLLITQLRGLLNPIQVWDLADGGPEEILESFSELTRFRILVCGGDGTVSWIVSTIEKMKLHRWPPMAILPLGTGNDLARIHGWGGGYNNESLIGILEQVAESYVSWLDRWEITIENKKGKEKQVKSFFNYLGVGVDAQAALQVHMLRESRPKLFFSRVVNKAWYALFGAEDIIKATSVNLPHEITLIADGVEIPLPPDSQGIIMLNIDSYSGGVPLWSGSAGSSPMGSRTGSRNFIPLKRSRSLDAIKSCKGHASMQAKIFDRVDSVEDIASMALSDEERHLRVTACDRPSSCQDGLLDVVSVRGAFHLGQIRVGLSNPQKICQCREATIIIKRKVSVQIDGEPWRQNVCTLRVKRKKDAAIMLHRSADDSNGVETEMAKLLDWAEERKLIDNKVHAALMKEFSRRIESKTRQRRVRSQDNLMFSLKRAMGSSASLQKGFNKSSNGIMF